MSLRHEGGFGAAHRRSHRGVLRLLFLSVVIPTIGIAHAGQTTPYIPTGPGVVLQRVPPTTDPRVRQFDRLRADLGRHPHDAVKAVALARAYVDYGRATGDARFLGRAMAVIDPFMAQPTPPIPVLLVHATIQQSRHFFREARKELQAILRRDPGNAQAWLTLATVAMVQGDVDQANRACIQLANTGGDFMGAVCSASLRSLTGRGKQAYVLLSMVEDPGPRAPDAIKAWIEGLMADTARRMGKPALAETHFKAALQRTPGDNFLLADYGDFLLDQKRPQEVIDLIGGQTESDTSFLRVVLAEQALGLPRAAADAERMRARFASIDQRGSHVYRREQAAFVLHVQHDPKRALALAKQNWTVQRAPEDARVYLEAALAADEPAAAAPVLEFLDHTHLSDVAIDPLAARARTLQAAATAGSAASVREVPR